VLTGPDNVDVDDVSVEVSNTTDTACAVCGDSFYTLRKLSVCGHHYCVECLDQQLHTQHTSRYKCALCRAYLPQ
jgi:hypothetical protein